MSLSVLMPRLGLLLTLASAMMIVAGRAAWPAGSLAAAVGAALALAYAGWWINRPPRDPLATPRRNARLQALIFGWGGATLLAAYPLAGLKWQHGWQYGAGLALLAVLTFAIAVRLGRHAERHGAPWRPGLMSGVTIVQGLACAGGLVWMAAIGKLADTKESFVAHHVLGAGGLAVLALAGFAIAGERRAQANAGGAGVPSPRA